MCVCVRVLLSLSLSLALSLSLCVCVYVYVYVCGVYVCVCVCVCMCARHDVQASHIWVARHITSFGEVLDNHELDNVVFYDDDGAIDGPVNPKS